MICFRTADSSYSWSTILLVWTYLLVWNFSKALTCATDRGDAAKIKQASLPSPCAFFSYHFLYHDCTANVEPSTTTTATDGNFVNCGRKVNGELSLWKFQSKNVYNFLNWIHKMGPCLNLMFELVACWYQFLDSRLALQKFSPCLDSNRKGSLYSLQLQSTLPVPLSLCIMGGRLREVVIYKNRTTGGLFQEKVQAHLLYGR